ncbi:MAG TPA: TlyA family RNA methyltransferase [Chloroflexota bacterium]|jgi:23S rRNA (cytidine1920-2'-O)/16S rRNA (cytidine1409-2'-O)-methyltransferase|nr:TlyA family RNA methyltransferase [Chloroflexota bacterium]
MPAAKKQRLDLALVARGLASSREQARACILAGAVTVDGQVVAKPGALVAADASLAVRQRPVYVSRGGYKLAHALEVFGIAVRERVCLDAGASTGGFTDCLLQRGARRVYAVDVGYGQLDWRLRQDPRVVVMERVNLRTLTALPEPVDLATLDLSFISLRLVLEPVRALLRPGGAVVALIKPQFEAGRAHVGRGGVVRDPRVHAEVLRGVLEWAAAHGYGVRGVTASPLRGPAGNVEFLAYLVSDGGTTSAALEPLVAAALAEAAAGAARA